ncbi:transcription factor SRM1-like [Lycium barbarum]|uniref:transcription factor SRM1-like n=1 Tax=Lycium barbarum TaxID=112863 RepID=UPI00293E5DD3|nr:transcription factor SRM1-like [Lycium barbarum]
MSYDRTWSSSAWTKEEDKASENTLAIYSGDSDLMMKIAAVVPQKSLQEINQHHNDLVKDVSDIESGPKYGQMQSCSSRRSRSSGAVVERRKGIPRTAEEHRLFVQGLDKHGKGDWRNISRNCVRSRTLTQVASHARKFFSRLNDNSKAKRRRSIHDITSVNAAYTTEPSQGPITDYVTEAFDVISLPGQATNCAIEGPSAVNPKKFSLSASVGSELNNSSTDLDEFLLRIGDLITEPAAGTSGVCHQ